MAMEERLLAAKTSDDGAPCLRVDIARLRRRLGFGDDAELALAREWMKDADDSLRQRALDILGGLESPESNNLIALMLQDPDRFLADRARQVLANRKRRSAP
jgi:HEAT repeat protein